MNRGHLWVLRLVQGFRQQVQSLSALRRRFLVGAFWSIFGAATRQGLALVAQVLVARLLGPTGLGELGIIQSTVNMVGTLAGAGLGVTGTRYIAELRTTDRLRSGRILGLTYLTTAVASSVGMAALFLLAPMLAQGALGAPQLGDELRLASVLLLVTVVDGVQVGVLAGFEAFRAIAVSRAVYGLAIIPLAYLGSQFLGVQGAILAFTIAGALACLTNYLFLRQQCRVEAVRVTYSELRQEVRILFSFSLPATLSGVMVGPAIWVSNALFVHQPQGYRALGLFTAAGQWRTAVLFLPTAFSNVLLSLLSEQGDRSSEDLQTFNILSSWLVGLLFATPLLALPELVWWLYGDDYDPTAFKLTLSVLMLAVIIVTYKDGLARVLASRSLMWWSAASNALWAMLLVGSTFLFRSWGSVGLSFAYLVAYGLNTILFLPLYVGRGLVPRATMISWNVLAIWAFLGALSVLVLLDYAWYIRVAGLVGFGFVAPFLLFLLAGGSIPAWLRWRRVG